MGAWADLGRRIVEAVEDRTGREVVPRERLEVMESAEGENRSLRKALEFINFRLFNQPHGAGSEAVRLNNDLDHRARVAGVRETMRAWINDASAGQQVELYTSFVFGRGVPQPQAPDGDVQDVLDRTWADADNRRVLTDYARLVEKGVDLELQSNVLFRVHDDGWDIARLSLLPFLDVVDVVRHPRNEARVLYFRVREREQRWDWRREQYVSARPKTVYYEAHGAFDDANPSMVAQDEGLVDLRPPTDLVRPGQVVHLAVNKTSAMAFGVPRMRRLLRWYTAYNEMLEATLRRMKAAASIYMKQTVRGSERDLQRLAQAHLGRQSAFGAAQGAAPGAPGVLQQNDGVNYEALKIDAGTGDLAAAAPTVRGQTLGPWPDHYLAGQAATLAGASAMELPPLKFVEGEQEMWSGVFRALGQASIQAAIRARELTEWRDPTDLEAEKIAAAIADGKPLDEIEGLEVDPGTGQVKRDLSFEVPFPSPLKRAMGDVVSAAIQVAAAVDPAGGNLELSRWLLGFCLAEAFDVADPARIVDQVLPRRPPEAVAAEQQAQAEQQRQSAGGDPTSTGGDGRQHPASNPYGAQQRSAPVQEARRPRPVDDDWRDLERAVRRQTAMLDAA